MGDFFTETKIKRTRKPHTCRQCYTTIEVGSAALRFSGVWDGDFGSYYAHPDCMLAGDAHAHITRNWGEDYVFLWDAKDYGDLDKAWLMRFHPTVFPRLYP